MNRRSFFPLMAGAFILSACAKAKPKFASYKGPKITRVVVKKSSRKMWLLHNKRIIKKYKIDLGFAPDGPKQFEGDGKTPEGSYFIDRRNPKSRYYLSLGISYPNAKDIAYAQSQGKKPGGQIFIHGGPVLSINQKKDDWTAGCISVRNKEMRVIYAMIEDGTQIDILP